MSKELYNEATEEVHVTPAVAVDQDPVRPRRRKIGEGKWWRCFFEAGSAPQIICAAVVALAIGLGVNVSVDEVPDAAIAILGIPGRLWLRALQAVGEWSKLHDQPGRCLGTDMGTDAQCSRSLSRR